MQILKFGGTSVGKVQRMQQVAQLINDDHPKIVVLSALAGTTNALVDISAAYQAEDKIKVDNLCNTLMAHYQLFINDIYKKEISRQKARKYIYQRFDLLRAFSVEKFSLADEKTILAQGELMSTHLFQYYCEEIGLATTLLDALQFMKIKDGEPDQDFISNSLTSLLQKHASGKIFITQGYICKNEFGEIDNLRRGGSDYSASLIGAACQADEIQIWTDIDGMHNNDPRIVNNTYPIRELRFDEAAELAYFGAKILHPSSVLPAQKANIPVKLLNTLDPNAKGTVISSKSVFRQGIHAKAVAAKDGITAIRIKSSRMLYAYGFLKKIFEVFEKYRTPIDMITTSEVAVSLTIDDATNLEAIVEDLKNYAEIEVDRNQTIVCIVGNFSLQETGVALQVLAPLKNIPIRMISSGGSQSNISILIDSQYKVAALTALNEGLFSA